MNLIFSKFLLYIILRYVLLTILTVLGRRAPSPQSAAVSSRVSILKMSFFKSQRKH